ncbi:hypothetical protein ACOZDF_23270 [Streptomyces griseoincarnatus]
MVEIGLLAGAAVGILGDLLAGVVQGAAANTVSELVTSRLRGTQEGAQALTGLEEQPQDPARRMAAAGALATAAHDDSDYVASLREAVNQFSQSTNQGTTTSGSPHHQVNINGGGVSGKRHMIAGGNIDARKRNIRIGFGALAVILLVFGGYEVAQRVGNGDDTGVGGQKSDVQDGNISFPGLGPEENSPQVRKVNFDLTGSYIDLGDNENFFRSRGEVTITVGDPYKVDEGCSVKAPPGTSIVPVTIEMINTNDPTWTENEKFEPDTADLIVKDSPEGVRIGSRGNDLPQCASGFGLSTNRAPGSYREATLLLIGVPENEESKITLAAAGPDGARGFGYGPYRSEDGLEYRPKMKTFPISVKG